MNSLLRILAVGLSLMGAPIAFAQQAGTEAFINAPLAEVWAAFTAPDGLTRLGASEASVDLRLGGEIRVRFAADNAAPATMVREILAYDPQRMLALRTPGSPTWSIIYFTPSGDDMTHVRIVGVGRYDSPAAQTEERAHHRQLLDRLAKHYWPQCALCKADAENAD
jgi:uncharacterized protein YndB with AHSA1/START domain